MNAELNNLLQDIDQLKIKLDTARPLLNKSILEAVDIEYTYDSNRIEGNTLTLRETDIIINKGLTVGGKSMREHLEATNHYEAILFIKDLVQQKKEISESLIKNVHALILRGIDRENAGKYRWLALCALCLVVIQIVLGGWSSANYASANCQDLLSCEGSVLAAGHAADAFNPLREIRLDSSGQVMRTDSLGLLSMVHRLFAILTAGYLAWMVRKLKAEPALAGTVVALSVFSISQVIVGVGMIWLQLPLLMVTLHNALAAGLLLGSVNLLHRLTPAAGSGLPD